MKVSSLPARIGALLVFSLLAVGAIASTPEKKGRDGAACSSSDECVNTCEGGSCCTAHDDDCDSSSHCCGHQSCTNGKCP